METKWEVICYLMKINRNSREDLFQSEIVNIFEKLGWSRYNKEIEEKRKIQIGSAKSFIPDIIIKNLNKDLFVIELKKPIALYINRNDSQIFSYMRQLRLNVGLLINDSIHVFYEDNNYSVPVEILNIEFNEHSIGGPKFIALFSKETFNYAELIKYCSNQLRKLDVIDLISSNEYKEKVFELIKNDLRDHFENEVIDLAFKSIEINIQNREDAPIENKLSNIKIEQSRNQTSSIVDYDNSEIEKVKRKVPRWLNRPNQINSLILINSMETLFTNENTSYKELESKCYFVDKFKSNFDQMAIIAPKNHGKVFDRKGDFITLWPPVQKFIREAYSAFLQRR